MAIFLTKMAQAGEEPRRFEIFFCQVHKKRQASVEERQGTSSKVSGKRRGTPRKVEHQLADRRIQNSSLRIGISSPESGFSSQKIDFLL